MLALQRGAGNAAVARMIARAASPLLDARSRRPEGELRTPEEAEREETADLADVELALPPQSESRQPSDGGATTDDAAMVAPVTPAAAAEAEVTETVDSEPGAARSVAPQAEGADPAAPQAQADDAGVDHAAPVAASTAPLPVADAPAGAPLAVADAPAGAPLAPMLPMPASAVGAASPSAASPSAAPATGVAPAPPAPAPAGTSGAGAPASRRVDDGPLAGALDAARNSMAAAGALTAITTTAPAAQPLVDTLTAVATRGEELLIQTADHALAAIAGEVGAQRTAVDAAAQAQRAEAAAAFETTRGHVASAQADETAALAATHERERSTGQTRSQQASQQVGQEVETRVQRARQLSEEHGQRVTAVGEQAAARARTELETAREQVSDAGGSAGPGGDPAAAGKAEVATRVGGDGAQQISRAAGEAPQHLSRHAGEAAGALREQGEQVASSMAGVAPTAGAEVQAAYETAADSQDLSRQRGTAALSEGAAAAIGGLTEQERAFTDGASDEVARVQGDLVRAGSQAALAIGEQVREAIAEGRRTLEEQLAPLQGQAMADDPEPEHAESDLSDGEPPPADEKDAGIAEAVAQVEEAYADAADELRGAGGRVTPSLADAGREAAEGIGGLTNTAREQLEPAAGQVSGALGRARVEAEDALVAVGNNAGAAADQVVAGTGAALDAALTQADTGLAGGVAQVSQSIDAGVADTKPALTTPWPMSTAASARGSRGSTNARPRRRARSSERSATGSSSSGTISSSCLVLPAASSVGLKELRSG